MTAVPPSSSRTTYKYARLGSINAPKSKENIFAIVTGSSAPVCLSQDRILRDITLTDETLPKFKFTLAYDTATKPPPEFFSPGTVVRFHRMVVEPVPGAYPPAFKGSGKAFGGQFSWVIYAPDGAGGLERRTFTKTFTSTPEDDERARELIRWWQAKGHPLVQKNLRSGGSGGSGGGGGGSQGSLVKICDITLDSGEISCVAFVLDIKLYEQKKKHYELFLWDGSGDMKLE